MAIANNIHLALFASGTGSNVKNIYAYFQNHTFIHVSLLVCNNPNAKVLDFAIEKNLPYLIISNKDLHNENFISYLQEKKITHIILAGFLALIPKSLINKFPNAIINIHPSLLPKYGGKGMYGHHVHEAIINNKEKHSGITIHYINEKFDEGEIIFQASCDIEAMDTSLDLAKKVQKLEKIYFPYIIEQVVNNSRN